MLKWIFYFIAWTVQVYFLAKAKITANTGTFWGVILASGALYVVGRLWDLKP